MIIERSVYVLMMTHNDVEKIDATIESVLNQTLDRRFIKFVAIDNASTDGTYEKLLHYECKYPSLISVIRESQQTTDGRLLKQLMGYLQYTKIDFSLLISPGDAIYQDYLEHGLLLLTLNKEVKVLISEVDTIISGKKEEQIPIFSTNCILRAGLCRNAYYTSGIGHKVQAMFRGLVIELAMKLPYFAQVVDINEWFTMSFYVDYDCMYIRKKTGCVIKKEEDIMKKLIQRAFFIKRNFYSVETGVFSTLKASSIEMIEVKAGYRCLAIMALQYAVDEIEKNSIEIAKQCLVYAEMMDLDIISEKAYIEITNTLSKKTPISLLRSYLKQSSSEPPRESPVF